MIDDEWVTSLLFSVSVRSSCCRQPERKRLMTTVLNVYNSIHAVYNILSNIQRTVSLGHSSKLIYNKVLLRFFFSIYIHSFIHSSFFLLFFFLLLVISCSSLLLFFVPGVSSVFLSFQSSVFLPGGGKNGSLDYRMLAFPFLLLLLDLVVGDGVGSGGSVAIHSSKSPSTSNPGGMRTLSMA